jgi:hypothetical protein
MQSWQSLNQANQGSDIVQGITQKGYSNALLISLVLALSNFEDRSVKKNVKSQFAY